MLPGGMLKYGAPLGGHDDTVTALGLAYAAGRSEPAVVRTSYGFNRR